MIRLICFFTSLCFVPFTHATPMQYSISGNVTYIDIFSFDNEELSVFAASNFYIGQVISYEFLVDFSRPGECTDPTTYIVSVDCSSAVIDEPPGATFDYFYTKLLSASNFIPLTWFDAFLNYGLSQGASGRIFGESVIWVEGSGWVDSWVEGMSLIGIDYWESNTGYGLVESTLVLTEIKPIPEAPTLFLFLLGLLFVSGRNIRTSSPKLKSKAALISMVQIIFLLRIRNSTIRVLQ